MALWLTRAGGSGEFENKFLSENRIYLTWEGLDRDLGNLKKKQDLYKLLEKAYPDSKPGRLRNWIGQIWAFAKEMASGDWVVLPSKKKAAVHIGEIAGSYVHASGAEDLFQHYREVNWIGTDIPRSNFDQDLLYSFGALMTICRVRRNDAEKRVRAMAKNEWRSALRPRLDRGAGAEADSGGYPDLERLARDEIAKFLIAKFKGHGMTRLVEAILGAQGYMTYRSPEGPDKGVDILAAPGTLGFGNPRLCVQVKATQSPVDRPTLDQLVGAMQNFHAEQGLLVSWGGFKSSVDKEVPAQFFRVRLWDQDALIEELLNVYHELDEDMRAELPLKRVWMMAFGEED